MSHDYHCDAPVLCTCGAPASIQAERMNFPDDQVVVFHAWWIRDQEHGEPEEWGYWHWEDE